MKTFIVLAENKVNDHAGENYDSILEVENMPLAEPVAGMSIGITEWTNRIRGRIRGLWEEDKADEEREGDPVVSIYLDAASPFNAMLIDLQIVMMDDEKIKIELPYLDTAIRTTEDAEANEVIDKLESRR